MLKNKFEHFKNSGFFLPDLFMIASIMFLSIIYAILTSTLNIIGSGKVLAKEITDYYYKGGYFYSDENCENKVWSVSKQDYLSKMTDVVNQMSDGNNIYILSEYSVDENEDINISGKNIIIKRHESYSDSSLIKVTSGSSLNISVSADSALVIDGQEVESTTENGSVFYVDTNGILSVCGEGTKNIIIQNNVSTSAINGGIVYIAQEGNVNFENVSIKENKISSSGNIYGSVICAMGTLTFENSEITKNTISASSDYGSLYVKNTASVTLINDVIISENKNTVSDMQNNLCVDENTTVNTKNLDLGKGNSKIGVTTVTSPTSDSAVTFSSNGESSSNLSYFFSDNEEYIVKQYGGNLQIATEEYYYSQGYFYKEEGLKNKVLSSSDKTTPITKLYEAVNQIGVDGNIFLVTQYSPSSDEKIDVPTKKTVSIKRYSTFTAGSMLSIVNHDFTIQTFDSSSQITLDGCGIESTVSGSSDSGGGIFINGGSLTLKGYSGTQNIIVKNHKSKYESCFGVGINLIGQDGNVITLSNTKICDNVGNTTSSSTSYGGAIGMMSGDLVITDSVISGNGIYSQSGSSVGGAIYGLSTGTATLTRCTISNNVVSALSSDKDSFASAIGFYYGNLVLNETEILGNQVISVASTDSSGGAVNWSSSGNMTVKGKVIVKDNIYKYSDTEIPSNIKISKDCQMSTKDLSSGSYIGITSQVNPTLGSPVVFSPSSKATSTIDYFFSDNEDYNISKSSSGDLQLEYPPNYYYYYGSAGNQTTQGYFYTDSSHTNKVLDSSGNAITKLSDAVNIIHNERIIYLDSEYNLYSGDESIIVPSGKSLTIKKNFTVNNAMINAKNNCSIKGETGSNLVIDGSDTQNTGGGGGFWAGSSEKSLSIENITIQHCNAKNGAAIYVSNKVSATIKNVEIVNNRSEVSGNEYGRGVGVCNNGGGTVDVINCNIHGNTVLPKNSSTITLHFYGVGVYCTGEATTNLTNCKIYDNTFSNSSGHSIICKSAGVFNESTMTITDCSITNNKSLTGSGSGSLTGYGSGVYQNKSGTLSLSGVVTVNDNTFGTASDNLYLASGGSINTKNLKSGSKIGIKSETAPTASSSVTISKSSEAASTVNYFFSDNSSYYVSKGSGGDLQLKLSIDYYYYYGTSGSQTTQGYFYTDSSHTNKVLNSSGSAITKISDVIDEINSGKTIYLDSEYNLYSGNESIVVPSGKSLTIKKNFTVARAMINAKNNCSIKGETGSNLVIDGAGVANSGEGGAFWAGTSGKSLSLENITIQNCSSLSGAGIYIENSVSATIKNVEIVNNESSRSASNSSDCRGTGICNKGGGTVDVIGCSIHGNTASNINTSFFSGASLYIYGVGVHCSGSGAVTNLKNCEIYDNGYTGSGYMANITCEGIGIYNESTMTITDCSITNNKSLELSGSGVFMNEGSGIHQNNKGTLSLSGVVTVNGNTFTTTAYNLYLVSGGYINTKGLKSGSKIGIRSSMLPTSSSPITISKSGEAASSASYFTSDNSKYTVILKDGVLSLALLEEAIAGNTKQFTINSSNPSIKITPDGYYYPSDSSSMTSFTGTYILTGTFTGTSSSTPSIIFENTYSTTKTIKVKFKDLVLKAYDWCTLGYISGNAPMEIYMTSEGTNSLQAYNHPSFQIGSDAAEGTNVRLSVTSGSILLGSVYSGTSYKVITDKANLYFNDTLFTEKSKNTTFTSSGYTQ